MITLTRNEREAPQESSQVFPKFGVVVELDRTGGIDRPANWQDWCSRNGKACTVHDRPDGFKVLFRLNGQLRKNLTMDGIRVLVKCPKDDQINWPVDKDLPYMTPKEVAAAVAGEDESYKETIAVAIDLALKKGYKDPKPKSILNPLPNLALSIEPKVDCDNSAAKSKPDWLTEIAMEYRKRGYNVIPVYHRALGKIDFPDEWQKHYLERQPSSKRVKKDLFHAQAIAIAPSSGTVVIDLDTQEAVNRFEKWLEINRKGRCFPAYKTLNGKHYWVRLGNSLNQKIERLQELGWELLVEQAIIPPSPSRKNPKIKYEFSTPFPESECDIPLIELDELCDALTDTQDQCSSFRNEMFKKIGKIEPKKPSRSSSTRKPPKAAPKSNQASGGTDSGSRTAGGIVASSEEANSRSRQSTAAIQQPPSLSINLLLIMALFERCPGLGDEIEREQARDIIASNALERRGTRYRVGPTLMRRLKQVFPDKPHEFFGYLFFVWASEGARRGACDEDSVAGEVEDCIAYACGVWLSQKFVLGSGLDETKLRNKVEAHEDIPYARTYGEQVHSLVKLCMVMTSQSAEPDGSFALSCGMASGILGFSGPKVAWRRMRRLEEIGWLVQLSKGARHSAVSKGEPGRYIYSGPSQA